MKLLMALLIALVVSAANISAQTSAFTYQGKLADAGAPATGPYDLTFRLFPTVSGGAQIGADVVRDDVQVTTGVFTVSLDFGASPFTSDTARYLEIAVRPGASTGAYTTLVPRQPITSSPYAVASLNATNATNATQLGGVAASQFVQTGDTRLSDARTPTAGSTSYIQNTITPQASSNFNISGNGTVGGTLSGNIVDTATQYNLGGSRVLSVGANGLNNVFAGVGAGFANGTSGFNNAFFGFSAGFFNTGSDNAFFGRNAGFANTTGNFNSFFGNQAGRFNTTAINNSFFGNLAGTSNLTGSANSFFGVQAGQGNQNGASNSFFGASAGQNTVGSTNSFFGRDAGIANSSGSDNTLIGAWTNVGASNLSNATAIGARSQVSQSNSLVLGSINGVNGATADTNVGIGTAAPARKLHISGSGSDGAGQTDLRITGTGTIASGITLESTGAGGRTYSWLSTADNIAGGGSGPGRLAVFDVTAGAYRMVIDGSGNVGIGTFSPSATLEVTLGGTTLADAWTTRSSARFKSNIQTIPFALNKVLQLRGVTFDYKDTQKHSLGFIAEEVGQVLPEVVEYEANGRDAKGLDYNRLTPLVVEAIKEQQLQLDLKDAEIQTLKSGNAALNARLSKIERMMQEFKSAPAQQPARPGPRRPLARRHRFVSR